MKIWGRNLILQKLVNNEKRKLQCKYAFGVFIRSEYYSVKKLYVSMIILF